MKNIYTLFILIILVNNTKADWEQIHPEISADKKDTIYHFSDDLRLIAEDTKGNIFVGGDNLFKYDKENKKWKSIPTELSFGLAADMDKHNDTLYVCSNTKWLESTIGYTFDDGKSWNTSKHGLNLFDIDVFENGYAVASGIKKWNKYGDAMTYVIFFERNGANYGLSFLDGYEWRGFYVGSEFLTNNIGYYYGSYEFGITNNRGKSWKRIMLSCVNGGEGLVVFDTLNFVASIPSLDGYGFDFIKSIDAGNSYTIMDTNKYLGLLEFQDPLVGFACQNRSEKDTLIKTLDGGKTWINLDTVISGWDITQIYSEVPGEVWVIGSDSRVFRYTTPLNPPNLISPNDSTYSESIKHLFQWESNKDAVKYQIELSLEPDMSYPFQSIFTAEPEIVIDSLKANQLMYWHVRTFSNTDVSNWSEIRMLSTLDFMTEEKPAIFLSLFPNPCEDILKIEFLSFSDTMQISCDIYDYYGNHCFSKSLGTSALSINIFPININMLTSGVYFLKLRIGQTQYSEKFIKQE